MTHSNSRSTSEPLYSIELGGRGDFGCSGFFRGSRWVLGGAGGFEGFKVGIEGTWGHFWVCLRAALGQFQCCFRGHFGDNLGDVGGIFLGPFGAHRRISVVMMRQEASVRSCTSPVSSPTSPKVALKSRNF